MKALRAHHLVFEIGRWLLAAIPMGCLLLAVAPGLLAQKAPPLPRTKRSIEPLCPHTTADMYAIEEFYSMGQFDSIASRRDCLLDLFDKTRSGRAPSVELQSVAERFMYLYALCNVQLYRSDAAEEAAMMLMERFPRHKFRADENPPQMRSLLDSLVPYHAHHFGVYAGANVGIFNGAEPLSVRDDITPAGDVVVGPELSKLPRFTAGVEWQYHFSYRHSLLTGLGLQTLAYRTAYASRNFKGTPQAVGDWQLRATDSHTYLQIPLSYEFRIPIHQTDPERRSWLGISAGLYGGYLLQAVSDLHTTSWESDAGGSGAVVPIDRDFTLGNLKLRRNTFTGGATGAVSLVSTVGLVNFYVRLGGQLSFQKLQAAGSGLSADFVDYIWSYHVGDQGRFKLHAVNLTAGILLPRSNRVKNLRRP